MSTKKAKLPTHYRVDVADSSEGWSLTILAGIPTGTGEINLTPVIGKWTERTYVTAFDALQGARRAVDDFEYALKTKEAA